MFYSTQVVIRRKIVSLQVLKHRMGGQCRNNDVVIRRKILSLQVLKHLYGQTWQDEAGCDSQKNCIFASS